MVQNTKPETKPEKTAKAETSTKQFKRHALNAAKKTLSMTGRILVELIEQYEDFYFLHGHHWAGNSGSIRSDRYAYESRKKRREQQSRWQALQRLKKDKFIKERKEGDRVITELTTSGKIKAIQTVFNLSEYLPDGKLCLVSFDFPEAAHTARDRFRYFLKKNSFKFVHGSVWTSNKKVLESLKAIIKLLRIEKWVQVYLVDG